MIWVENPLYETILRQEIEKNHKKRPLSRVVKRPLLIICNPISGFLH